MSGFRDFSHSGSSHLTKTLSSSLDEDDWDTTPDVPVTVNKPSDNNTPEIRKPSNANPSLSFPKPPKPSASSSSLSSQNGGVSSARGSVGSSSIPLINQSSFSQQSFQSNPYVSNQEQSQTSISASGPTFIIPKSPSVGLGSEDYRDQQEQDWFQARKQGSSSQSSIQFSSASGLSAGNSLQSSSYNALASSTVAIRGSFLSFDQSQNTSNAVFNQSYQKPTISNSLSPSSAANISPFSRNIASRPATISPSTSSANLPSSLPATLSSVVTLPLPTPSSSSTTNYSQQKMGINTAALAAKFPFFTPSEIAAFHQQYSVLDKDGNNLVHPSDLSTLATKTGESFQVVTAKLSQLSLGDKEGFVSFEEFLQAVSSIRKEKGVAAAPRDAKKIVLHGHMENTTHTINEDEKESFTTHINQQLGSDKDLKSRLPIDPKSMQIFSECKDGLILAKLINDSVNGTIDERVLNVGKMNAFKMTENNNLVVNSAKAIGCSVVNIGAQDLIEGREHLILGLIWQIIKIGLQAKIDIKVHPELFRLLESGETLEDFLKLPPEQILLRWFNYHLKKAGWARKVTNFGSDVKDGENYTVLLNQLKPDVCSRAPLQTADLYQRAEQVLTNAEKIGCRKYLTPKTLVEGNQKLNFAFVANLFNTHPGLEKLTEAEMAQLDEWLFSSEGDREARAFALWLNSLGVDPFINNLFDDLRDGLVLLQAMDRVRPGMVDWKKVNKPAPIASKFKKVENCNYVVVLGKSMKFSLVGIQGSDIVDGNKTLTLGLVWQLMRDHVVQTLRQLSTHDREITDADMIKWANETVRSGGKSSTMSNFKDSSLRNGHFFLDLLNSIKKGIVNYDLVSSGQTDDEAKLNAKYAISIARKLGATIFVLPEDIVEVKPKMILTFVGTLMALAKSGTLHD